MKERRIMFAKLLSEEEYQHGTPGAAAKYKASLQFSPKVEMSSSASLYVIYC